MKNTKQQPVASSRGRRNSDVLVYEPAKKASAQIPEVKVEPKSRRRDPIGIRMGYAQMTSHDSFIRTNGFE